jgi:hypothetical protein
MGEAGQVEWLGVGQPVQQQLLPFREHRRAGCPQDGEYWVLDAVRVVFGERPLLDGGYFLGEAGVSSTMVTPVNDLLLRWARHHRR